MRPDKNPINEPDTEDSDIKDRIMQFFEKQPYFYDTIHRAWTNKKMKVTKFLLTDYVWQK